MIRLRVDLSALDANARKLFTAFLERALAGKENQPSVLDAVLDYFRDHPLPHEISRCFERVFATRLSANIEGGNRAFAAFVGPRPLAQKPAATEHDVRSGPLARFQLNLPSKE